MLERIKTWKIITEQFLDPRERGKRDSYRDRRQIFEAQTRAVQTLSARRVCPTQTPGEILFFNSMITEEFPFERSPAVLQEQARFSSEAITGIIGFLEAEKREPCYGGLVDRNELGAATIQMAWSLTSLAKRSDLPDVQDTALKEITRLKRALKPDRSGSDAAGKILKILSAEEKFPSTSLRTLREGMGNSLFENPFTQIEGDGKEMRVQVSNGCNFPLKWTPPLTWAALRFPHAGEITIEQDEKTITLNASRIREWVIANPPHTQPADLHEFYSLDSAKAEVKAPAPLLESGKPARRQPFSRLKFPFSRN